MNEFIFSFIFIQIIFYFLTNYDLISNSYIILFLIKYILNWGSRPFNGSLGIFLPQYNWHPKKITPDGHSSLDPTNPLACSL